MYFFLYIKPFSNFLLIILYSVFFFYYFFYQLFLEDRQLVKNHNYFIKINASVDMVPTSIKNQNTYSEIQNYSDILIFNQLLRINYKSKPYGISEPLIPKDHLKHKKTYGYTGILIREIIDFVYIKNIIIGLDCFYDREGNYYNYRNMPTNPEPIDEIRINCVFNEAVWCCYIYRGFGHFIHDHMASLIFIPDWVWGKHPILITKIPEETAQLYLKILNLEKFNINLYRMYKHEFIFCNNMYFAHSLERSTGFSYETYNKLRNKFLTYFKTTEIIPTDYNCMNKEPNRRRHIHNLGQLIDSLNNITNKTWSLIPNKYSDVSKVAKIFASTKLLVLPQGAITFNMFYMHPNTGMLILMSDTLDICNITISFLLGIWTISQLHKNIPIYGGKGGDIVVYEVRLVSPPPIF